MSTTRERGADDPDDATTLDEIDTGPPGRYRRPSTGRRHWLWMVIPAVVILAGLAQTEGITLTPTTPPPATIEPVPQECLDALDTADDYQIAANEALYMLTYTVSVEDVWAASGQLDTGDAELTRALGSCRSALAEIELAVSAS